MVNFPRHWKLWEIKLQFVVVKCKIEILVHKLRLSILWEWLMHLHLLHKSGSTPDIWFLYFWRTKKMLLLKQSLFDFCAPWLSNHLSDWQNEASNWVEAYPLQLCQRVEQYNVKGLYSSHISEPKLFRDVQCDLGTYAAKQCIVKLWLELSISKWWTKAHIRFQRCKLISKICRNKLVLVCASL